jgi:hypothetical protein
MMEQLLRTFCRPAKIPAFPGDFPPNGSAAKMNNEYRRVGFPTCKPARRVTPPIFADPELRD